MPILTTLPWANKEKDKDQPQTPTGVVDNGGGGGDAPISLKALPWETLKEEVPPEFQDIHRQGGVDPNDPGLHQVVNDSGNKQTFYTIPKDINSLNLDQVPIAPIPGAPSTGQVLRVGGGAITKGAQGILSFGEYFLDTLATDMQYVKDVPILRHFAKLADTLISADDRETNWINENLPTITADNGGEEILQDIGSMLIGAKGANLISKYGEFGKTINAFWLKSGKSVPKTITFLQSILATDIGITIATPQNTKALSTELGLTPEQYGTLDKETSNRLSLLFDNMTMDSGLHVAVKGVKFVGDFLYNTFGKAFAIPKLKDSGITLLKLADENIDPKASVKDMEAQINAMSDVLEKYKSTFVEIGSTKSELSLGTVQTLKRGAVEYFEKAYAIRKSSMSPDEWKAFVETNAMQMVNQMAGLKRLHLSSFPIREADASIMKQTNEILTKASDTTASMEESNAVARDLADPFIQEVKSTKSAMDEAAIAAEKSSAELLHKQTTNEIIQQLDAANSAGKIGTFGFDTANGASQKLSGDALLNKILELRNNVTAKFNAIPSGIGVKTSAFIYKIGSSLQSMDDQALRSFLGTMGLENQINSAGKLTPKIATDIIAKYGNTIDFKFLFNKVRPELSKAISNRMAIQKDAQPLIQIRDWIDTQLTGVASDAEPAVREAMDAYKQFRNTVYATEPMRALEPKINAVAAVGDGMVKGIDDFREAGMSLVNEIGTSNTSGAAQKVISLFESVQPGASKELAQETIYKGLNTLFEVMGTGEGASSAQLRQAFNIERMTFLERTDPATAKLVKDTIANLDSMEKGNATKLETLAKMTKQYDTAVEKASTDAASAFMANITKDISFTGNPQMAFRKLFSSENAPLTVETLFNRAKETHNLKAIEGIRAQFLRYIQNTVMTNKSLLPDVEGFVMGGSPAKTGNLLNEQVSNAAAIMRTLYKDDKASGEGIAALLDTIKEDAHLNMYGPYMAGSDTVFKMGSIKDTVSRMITIGFGVLSHPGAIIRSGVSPLLQKAQASKDALIDFYIQKQIADPTFFKRALNEAEKSEENLRTLLIKEFPAIALATANAKKPEMEQTRKLMEQTDNADTPVTKQDNASTLPDGYEQDDQGYITKKGAQLNE